MKTSILTLLLIISSISFAQDIRSIPPSPEESNLTFGWMYSPEVAYRFLSEGNEANENTATQINDRNADERPKFGQSFSFFWGYKLSKLFTLEGGFGYTDFGEAEKDAPIYLDPFSLEEFGKVSSSHHIHTIYLPISLQVNLGGKRVQGYISGGIAPGIISRYTTYDKFNFDSGSTSTQTNYSVNAQKSFNNIFLGAHISGGIHWRYNEKTSVRIAPVLRVSTTNMYSSNSIRGNYFNAGIEFGTIYRL